MMGPKLIHYHLPTLNASDSYVPQQDNSGIRLDGGFSRRAVVTNQL